MAGGRPTAFKPEYKLLVKYMGKAGLTDAQIAEQIGVTEQTINNWKKAEPAFFESLKEGKAEADDIVERSLFERATGYSHNAVKIFMPAGAKEPVYAEYVEHFPPDPTSMIFWLKNRRPEQWRDKHDIEHSGKVEGNIIVVRADGKAST